MISEFLSGKSRKFYAAEAIIEVVLQLVSDKNEKNNVFLYGKIVPMKEARWYEKVHDNKVKCELCPHRCVISPGRRGICEVRENRDGQLVTLNYGLLSSVAIDPIEKKPLYHFFPGGRILSIGSFGCNLQCKFCQNYEISQVREGHLPGGTLLEPSEIAEQAVSIHENIGVAYTYNEPVIFYETMFETAIQVKARGLKNVMVTNGYINPKPLEELMPYIDAFNVDLKANEEHFYHIYTASRLAPVKETLLNIRKAGKHLEITSLIIPGLNDDEGQFNSMVEWIAMELGRDTPLHLSRYFPRHLFTIPPTPEKTLLRLFEIARFHLTYVYVGNLYTQYGQDTRCPSCNSVLIARSGYNVTIKGLQPDGTCRHCNTRVPVIMGEQ